MAWFAQGARRISSISQYFHIAHSNIFLTPKLLQINTGNISVEYLANASFCTKNLVSNKNSQDSAKQNISKQKCKTVVGRESKVRKSKKQKSTKSSRTTLTTPDLSSKTAFTPELISKASDEFVQSSKIDGMETDYRPDKTMYDPIGDAFWTHGDR